MLPSGTTTCHAVTGRLADVTTSLWCSAGRGASWTYRCTNRTGSSSTSCCACSAASIISWSRRMSRRIERSRLFQDGLGEQRMQGNAGHQVDGAAEDLRQLVREVVDLPPEPGAGPQRVKQVEVARRRGIATSHRAEDGQGGDAVPVAHGGE